MNQHRDCGQRIEALRSRLKEGARPPLETGELLDLLWALEQERENQARHIAGLDAICSELVDRLLTIENSRLFRLLRMGGSFLMGWKRRLGQLLLHSPFHAPYARLVGPPAQDYAYRCWVEQERFGLPDADWFRTRLRVMSHRPVFSVLIPVHNPRREWLEAAVESVVTQHYPCWELCVCDDASREEWVREYFEGKAATDARIRFVRSESNLGIAGATNRAGELARGAYVAFLDQDDTLAPHALHLMAEAVHETPADLIYSDEDRLQEDGSRVEPIFKPAWSPDLLLSCMYMGHLLVARREVLEQAGWLRSEFDGSQDYDLALRLVEPRGRICHIPHVLYHWRKHPGSTAAQPDAKGYTHEAGRRALAEAVARRQYNAVVEDGPIPNTYHLRRRVSPEPKVSIVVCSRKSRLLRACLRGIRKQTSYTNREVVVVQHSTRARTDAQDRAENPDCVRIVYTGPFHFSDMNNRGAAKASGDVLVFMNDDVTPLDSNWLHALVAHAMRPDAGVVGARLLYPGGAIQHAGMVTGIMNGAGHIHRHTFGSSYWPWWFLTRDVSAVTGACLAIRREVFEQLGGFDLAFPVNYNDVDLCLRARQNGYRVIYEPAALLRHAECQTRVAGVRYAERTVWAARWAEQLASGDPYYNPNLAVMTEDVGLNPVPPRIATDGR